MEHGWSNRYDELDIVGKYFDCYHLKVGHHHLLVSPTIATLLREKKGPPLFNQTPQSLLKDGLYSYINQYNIQPTAASTTTGQEDDMMDPKLMLRMGY